MINKRTKQFTNNSNINYFQGKFQEYVIEKIMNNLVLFSRIGNNLRDN